MQAKAAAANPKLAQNDTLWLYPKSKAEYPSGWDGVFLNDVVSANFPFTQLADGPVIPGELAADDDGSSWGWRSCPGYIFKSCRPTSLSNGWGSQLAVACPPNIQ